MAGAVRVVVDAGATAEALAALAARVPEAAALAVARAAHVGERAIKQQLTTSSHPRGTPTPSAPGEPPSLVTGSLRRSVQVVIYPAAITPYADVGPTMIYGRVQELGGGWSNLPARPYVAPAHEDIYRSGEVLRAMVEGFAQGMGLR